MKMNKQVSDHVATEIPRPSSLPDKPNFGTCLSNKFEKIGVVGAQSRIQETGQYYTAISLVHFTPNAYLIFRKIIAKLTVLPSNS